MCPLCGASVKHVPGEDIHVTFDRHAASPRCDPSKHPAMTPRCPVPGCREKLVAVNAYRCKACRAEVCLKHRFAESHLCGTLPPPPPARATPPNRRTAGNPSIEPNRRVVDRAVAVGIGSTRGSRPHADPSRGSGRVPVVRGSDAPPTKTTPPPAATRRTIASAPREICDACGRSFPHLAALIAHAEAEHAGGGGDRGAGVGGRRGGGAREVCPRCGAGFSDVGALVAHVESAHEGGAAAGGGGARTSKAAASQQCVVC